MVIGTVCYTVSIYGSYSYTFTIALGLWITLGQLGRWGYASKVD